MRPQMTNEDLSMKIEKPNTDWGKAQFTVTNPPDAPITITVMGRNFWALECLNLAGEKGCTPIDTPGPRWSGYVFNLRSMGVDIETITEKHGGSFKGDHARYVMHSTVTRLIGEVAA